MYMTCPQGQTGAVRGWKEVNPKKDRPSISYIKCRFYLIDVLEARGPLTHSKICNVKSLLNMYHFHLSSRLLTGKRVWRAMGSLNSRRTHLCCWNCSGGSLGGMWVFLKNTLFLNKYDSVTTICSSLGEKIIFLSLPWKFNMKCEKRKMHYKCKED